MNETEKIGYRVYLLTHADTDAVVFSKVLSDLPPAFAGSAVVPLQHIKSGDQLLKLMQSADEHTVCICRLLGNLSDVPGLAEVLKHLHSRKTKVIVLSGTGERKPELESLSNIDSEMIDNAWLYLMFGGVANIDQMVAYLSDRLFATNFGSKPPSPVAELGIYHPRLLPNATLEDWRKVAVAGRPTVGISFYRAHWLSGNTAFIDTLIAALEKKGLNCLPVFTSSGRTAGGELPPAYSLFVDSSDACQNPIPIVDAIINTTSFSMSDANAESFTRLDVPIIQAICTGMTEDQWWTSTRGLNALDTAMNVAMPEFDGRIITVPISAKETLLSDGADSALYKPLAERAERVAGIASRQINLKYKPNSEKKVAFVFTNASSKASQIGNAVGLDAPQSLMRLLTRMREKGYNIKDVPESADLIIHELIDRCSYDQTYLTEAQCDRAIGAVPSAEYRNWFNQLPTACQDKMTAQWGEAPGEAYVHNDKILIAGLELGNAVVILQPPRGYGMDQNAIYHQPDLAPTHHYFAVYRWLTETWGADAIVHVGKHGTLEWLPGKGVGLSSLCFPDAFLQDLPLIYPFIINDPGEGSQAKRRSHAVVVDHLPPPLTTADTYGVLAELTELVDEYYRCEALDPTKLPLLRQQIWDLIKQAKLDEDLQLIMEHDHDDDEHDHLDENGVHAGHDHHHEHDVHAAHDHHHEHDVHGEHDDHHEHDDDHWDPTLSEEGVPISLTHMDSVKVSHLVQEIDGYLCELGLAQIRDGLHILGQVPEGTSLIETLACLTRLPNDGTPGLHATLAANFDLVFDHLLDNKGMKLEKQDSPKTGLLSRLVGKSIVTCADAIDALDELGTRLFAALLSADFDVQQVDASIKSVLSFESSGHTKPSDDLRKVLFFTCTELVPKLRLTNLEIENTLHALAGGYVPPGPSGAPSRGMAHILPTGRNFYSVDPRSVPSPSAWLVGTQLAQEVIQRFLQETKRYPESVCISVWGTSAMRTHGDDIAEILALLGVKPLWQKGSPRVSGLELIPLSELGRPRIDVTTRISGLFRDAFPHLIALVDQAVNMVIDQSDEPEEMNFVRKHYLEQQKAFHAEGLNEKQADLRSRYRIFGSKPGSYGAGILSLIQEQNWSDHHDIAEVYLNWGSFAYTARESGTEAKADFSQQLKIVDIAVHNQDNREHDIFDSDDYFQFHGGLIATVKALSGEAPKSYFGDSADPSRAAVRDLKQETLRVFRSRVVNPKWIESIKRHGYKGALELSATVDYLFGYDATANVLQDWMYEQVAQTYALDQSMQEFLQQSNPWALKAMSERLLEAARRQMWEKPEPATLEALKQAYLKSEAALEGRQAAPKERAKEPV